MNGFELLKIEESNDIVIDTLKKEKKYIKQKRNLEEKRYLTNSLIQVLYEAHYLHNSLYWLSELVQK